MAMKTTLVLVLGGFLIACSPQAAAPPVSANVAAWQKRAEGVTIVRDDWGVPHIYAKTDADVVFGLMYAQAEDDFNRVETNFINSQGRLAEAEGEEQIYRDLRMKLFIDPEQLKAEYAKSPEWLKALMDGWAEGLNFYLHTHPEVKPRVITRFEPWMALSFSEGSIGGDIERVNIAQLQAFYGGEPKKLTSIDDFTAPPSEPTGSNGIAVAGMNTASGKAQLLINPHTSFFFREEAQMVSEEGLNAYGALTWGQFFVYQGFNDKAGWMHTSSSVDNIDEYLETVTKKDDGSYTYRVGAEERSLTPKKIVVPYKTANGLANKEFTVYRTHRGPIVREVDGKWVSVRLMEEPMKALIQSYSRTKARSLAEYKKVMELHTNSSNNTLYADADGNIAYFHSNFIPKRDPKFDWTKPVDGSNPASEWNGVLSFDETPNVVNPPNGWVYNTNNFPFSAAGVHSPKQKNFPAYVDSGSENPRGVHAIRVLDGKKGFTVDSLIGAAYDSYLPEFEIQIPLLLKAHAQAPASNPLKARLTEQIAILKDWDYRWSAASVPTSVAIFYGEDLWQRVSADARKAGVSVYEYMRTRATAQQRLEALAAASDKLAADFGKWQTPWGDINRFQRLTADIVQKFDDSKPSTPVMFTSARWGSLASFGARAYPGTKKWYGTSGNSFVAVIEFGDRVKAKAVTAGGLNSVPGSKHFNDQAERYATGSLRDVYFYREQLKGHTEREVQAGRARAMTRATGTFEVKLAPQGNDGTPEGPNLARMSIDKQFKGDLEGTARGEMITAAGVTVKESAAYSAVERITGSLHGKKGSFALQHTGVMTMTRGQPSLVITVVPDSGTGELSGLAGKMDIVIESGKHSYVFEYRSPRRHNAPLRLSLADFSRHARRRYCHCRRARGRRGSPHAAVRHGPLVGARHRAQRAARPRGLNRCHRPRDATHPRHADLADQEALGHRSGLLHAVRARALPD